MCVCVYLYELRSTLEAAAMLSMRARMQSDLLTHVCTACVTRFFFFPGVGARRVADDDAGREEAVLVTLPRHVRVVACAAGTHFTCFS